MLYSWQLMQITTQRAVNDKCNLLIRNKVYIKGNGGLFMCEWMKLSKYIFKTNWFPLRRCFDIFNWNFTAKYNASLEDKIERKGFEKKIDQKERERERMKRGRKRKRKRINNHWIIEAQMYIYFHVVVIIINFLLDSFNIISILPLQYTDKYMHNFVTWIINKSNMFGK